MTIVGTSQFKKYDNGVERGYERSLPAVSEKYEQDEIEYVPGFWPQYGRQVLLSLCGAASCVALWVASTFSALASDYVPSLVGLGPTLMLSLIAGPLFLALPVKWYMDYRRALRVLGQSDKGLQDKVERALE